MALGANQTKFTFKLNFCIKTQYWNSTLNFCHFWHENRSRHLLMISKHCVQVCEEPPKEVYFR